jgi:catechol 2,3-dioxygenase-like lactoylglutathione lyase family enzyme
MKLGALDHVNVRTAKVQAMREWYVRVLGMVDGDRPPFPFPGAWLYTNDYPVVHLVGVEAEPANADPKLEHFAFAASGLQEFKVKLEQLGEKYDVRVVPKIGLVQFNIWDPDGNHIHIDFQPSEPGASDAPAWGNQDAMGKPMMGAPKM